MGDVKQSFQSANPAGSGVAGFIRLALKKLSQDLECCLPAIVQSYDRKKNIATVKPLIQVVAAADGAGLPRAPIASVPVLSLGGGEFFLNFPLTAGDLGWIFASDRDISLFKQGLSEAKPNTFRKHSFEDGLFIPDFFRNYTLDNEDFDDNFVLQHKSGKVRVALWSDRVKITANETHISVQNGGEIIAVAPTRVFFDTPLVEFSGTFTAGCGGKYGKENGKSIIKGALHATKEITSNSDVISQSVSLHNHVHSGVQSGKGTSGSPIK